MEDNTNAQVPVMVNQKEIDILESVFKDNERLLQSVRALFLGLGLTDEEKKQIKTTFANEELYKAVKRRFLPEMEKDAKIGQLQDSWLGAEQMIFGSHETTINQAIGYKAKSLEMVAHAMEQLRDPEIEPTDLTVSSKRYKQGKDATGIDILARNQFIRHVDQQLLFIWVVVHRESDEAKQRAAEVLQANQTQ